VKTVSKKFIEFIRSDKQYCFKYNENTDSQSIPEREIAVSTSMDTRLESLTIY